MPGEGALTVNRCCEGHEKGVSRCRNGTRPSSPKDTRGRNHSRWRRHTIRTLLLYTEKLIVGNEEAMLAWDRAVRGEHGGAHNPQGIGGKSGKKAPDIVKSDVIRLDKAVGKKGNSDYGTSAQSGLRRLERAASAGNPNAAEALRRVLDPRDDLTVNAACIALGWRKPTRTIVDTDEGLSDAIVRKIGPLDTMRQAWKRGGHQ